MITKFNNFINEFLDHRVIPNITKLEITNNDNATMYMYYVNINNIIYCVLITLHKLKYIPKYKDINITENDEICALVIDFDTEENMNKGKTSVLLNKYNMPIILANVLGVLKEWSKIKDIQNINILTIVLTAESNIPSNRPSKATRLNIYDYYIKKLGIEILEKIDMTEENSNISDFNKNFNIEHFIKVIKYRVKPIKIKDISKF